MSIFNEGTYPVRFHLRALGAESVRDPQGRFVGWRVPDALDDEARRLIAAAERGYNGPRRRRDGGGFDRVDAAPQAAPRAATCGVTVPPAIRAAALAATATDPLAAIHAARVMAAWVLGLVDAPAPTPAPTPTPRTFAALAPNVDLVEHVPGDATDVPTDDARAASLAADEADAGPVDLPF